MEHEKIKVLLSQYEKMMTLGTYYDQKLWLIPSSAYVILGIFYNFIFSPDVESVISFLLSILICFIFFGFLLQFVGDRSFQLDNQRGLNIIKEKLNMVYTSEFSGERLSDPKDRWFIRLIKNKNVSVFNIILYIMLLTLTCQIAVAAILLYRLINDP